MSDDSSSAELATALRRDLQRYPVHGKLPSSRELVRRHRVSPATVARAIAALAAEGLVVSRPGAGVFRAPLPTAAVAAGDVSWQEVALNADAGVGGSAGRVIDPAGVLAALADPPPGVIDLNGGYLHPTLQPTGALAAALARAARRPDAWSRSPAAGLAELRGWFARDIGGAGGALTADHVLITAGGQSALTTALRALAAPGAPVLVESPTYPGLLAIARASGLRPVSVPVDADGLRPDQLAAAFRETGARLLVCQPAYQNPTGAVLSAARRAEVLRLARLAGAFVVEDDFARLLAHADAPPLPPPLARGTNEPGGVDGVDSGDGHVVHIRSLTKPASPTLRISALAARGPALERLRSLHAVESFYVPRTSQEAALEVVSAPAWTRHLRTLGGLLRDRRETALAALAAHLPGLAAPRPPRGGYHLWLPLPPGTDEAVVVAAALHAGVAVAPGRLYFAAEPPGPHLRLSYVAAATTGELAEGVRRLARAFPV